MNLYAHYKNNTGIGVHEFLPSVGSSAVTTRRMAKLLNSKVITLNKHDIF